MIILVYQVTIMRKISYREGQISKYEHIKRSIKGVLDSDLKKYIPNSKGKFVCQSDLIEIDISKVNDDYCDCPLDGSDEPSTNACENGKFYCDYQPSPQSRLMFVPSSRVNDGICDCCDGSDEWNGVVLPNRLPDNVQKKLGRYQTPCMDVCLVK